MNKNDILTLYDYNYWATARALNAAAQLTPDQFTAPAGLSHGSVRGALTHILSAEMVWRLRLAEGVSLTALPTEKDFPSAVDALRERWADEEAKMRAYLNSLTDEALNRPVQYKTTKGVPSENILWNLLVHVVNHGTQFRSEAAVALTSYGHSPGDLDLLAFFREKIT
ncbi:MAG TPA: DinB family protein [Anaerolineae bacterium]|nr:DinB family protein [Anaerolineae bacterium]